MKASEKRPEEILIEIIQKTIDINTAELERLTTPNRSNYDADRILQIQKFLHEHIKLLYKCKESYPEYFI